MAWLEQTHVEEEMARMMDTLPLPLPLPLPLTRTRTPTLTLTQVLMMDTDMFLRAPVDPVALGVRRGNVVSAEYSYLHGTQSGFAKRFLEQRLLGRLAQVLYSRESTRSLELTRAY